MQATSLVDLYPTLLDLAKARVPEGHDIDGHSLAPLLSGKAGKIDTNRPQWALSQGHMADNAISWFVLREGDMKIIVYGTGEENAPQLFNISADPMETTDLASSPAYASTVTKLTTTLRSAIDYPAVALDVADYNQKMFRWYQQGGYNSSAGGNSHKHYGSWQEAVMNAGGLPGGPSGGAWAKGGDWGSASTAIAAIDAWMKAPPKVAACRPFGWKP